jgi:putative acetyltransferase
MTVREAIPADHDAIREVNRQAFGGEDEARLVDLLRGDGVVPVELVAVEAGDVVGHILFSHLSVETSGGPIAAVSLAPMSVRPEWQSRGIGSSLVREGLAMCRARGSKAVMVVGHPAYYPRFGFSARLAAQLSSPYSDAGDAWMAVELEPGALEGISGVVKYAEAFGALES